MKDGFVRRLTIFMWIFLLSCLLSGNVISEGGFSVSGTLSIPAETTVIEDYAFYGCSSLSGPLKLPPNVKSIGNYAFANCNGLTGRLIIPESVVSIGRRAFAGCCGLSGDLIIPAHVFEIGDDAFDQCTAVELLVYEGSYAQNWCENHSVSWRLLRLVEEILPVETGLVVKNGETAAAPIRVLPENARDSLVWTSSDDEICTVDQKGNVFGQYPGHAVLTVASLDGKVSVSMDVTVQANYRAVLFSESTFPGEVIIRNRGDVQLMTQMLASVTGPDGGKYEVSSFDDLTAAEVYDKITELLITPSRNGDVSMFFFASHGDAVSSTEQYAGQLWCKDKKSSLQLPTLARELTKINGKVIVLLESCGPGAALVTFKGTAAEDHEWTDNEAFSQSVINAFKAADPGLPRYGHDTVSSTGITGKGTNLFLTEKFIVMTAAAYHQTSYSTRHKTCNLFPAMLTDGVGYSGAMPADMTYGNQDGKLTVHELYRYVYENTRTRQTPMVYPENCDFVLFMRAE